jgi:CoA:oxalate CoA-transferase
MSKPFENIKVLDLTRILAGPYCTMMLNDLGAEVIKVEIPVKGDDSRHFGPFKDGKSLYFISINRGKKSITLNLKTEEGKALLEKMIPKVDVIVENFRPGTMEKLGLSYEVLKEINPRLIYAASSGFGHTGPDSRKPAYDLLAQALSGMMSITGWPDSPPTRVGMSIGDIGASLFTAIGISSALYQREKTGLGQKIDVAMLDCQIAILENAMLRYQVDGVPPGPIGNRHPTITPFQAFKAKDEYFVLAIGNDSLWKTLCNVLERNDLTEHEWFITNDKRTENITRLIPILEAIFVQKNAEEWIDFFGKAQLPCAPINTIDKVMQNKQALARNMIVEVQDKDIGTVKIAGNPIKMDFVPDELTRQPAPEIGENTASVLMEMLGLSQTEIDELYENKIL